MKLHYREMGEGQAFVILHGLFGYSDNWQTHAKKISEYYRVILVDQRNHGHSDWSDEHSYDAMAGDLEELVNDLGLDNFILMGHSMGGKTAMRYAQLHAEKLNKLIVVDMGIKSYPMHHGDILEGLKAIDLSKIASRGEAEASMQEHISSYGVRQFLLKNLYWKEKGQLAWRMNIPVLEARMSDILVALDTNHPSEIGTPTLFVRGALSNYITDEDYEEIEDYFIDSQITTIEGAGHWVHAEQAEKFIDTILGYSLR